MSTNSICILITAFRRNLNALLLNRYILLALCLNSTGTLAVLDAETAYRKANSIIWQMPKIPIALYHRDLYEGGAHLAHLCTDYLAIRTLLNKRISYVTKKLTQEPKAAIDFLSSIQKAQQALARPSLDSAYQLEQRLSQTQKEFYEFGTTEYRYHAGSNPFKKELFWPHLAHYFFDHLINSFLIDNVPAAALNKNRITQLAYEPAGDDPTHQKACAEWKKVIDSYSSPKAITEEFMQEGLEDYAKIEADIAAGERDIAQANQKIRTELDKITQEISELYPQAEGREQHRDEIFYDAFDENNVLLINMLDAVCAQLQKFTSSMNLNFNLREYISPAVWLQKDTHGGFRHAVPPLLPFSVLLPDGKRLPLAVPYSFSPITPLRYLLHSSNPIYRLIAYGMEKMINTFFEQQIRSACRTVLRSSSLSLTVYKMIHSAWKMALLGVDAQSYDAALNQQWITYAAQHANELVTLLTNYEQMRANYSKKSAEVKKAKEALRSFIEQAHYQNQYTLSRILKTRSIWYKGRIKFLILPVIALTAFHFRSSFSIVPMMAQAYVSQLFNSLCQHLRIST